jgi:hypothetical protein
MLDEAIICNFFHMGQSVHALMNCDICISIVNVVSDVVLGHDGVGYVSNEDAHVFIGSHERVSWMSMVMNEVLWVETMLFKRHLVVVELVVLVLQSLA